MLTDQNRVESVGLSNPKSWKSVDPERVPYRGPRVTRQPVPESASTVIWQTPEQPAEPRVIRVALVGLPNAGKSSLLNALLGAPISAVSPKVNTTRESLRGILTLDNCQFIFIDSPGIVGSHKRRAFSRELVKIAWSGYNEADLCFFVADVVKRPTNDCFEAVRSICGANLFGDESVPTALVVNKIDLAGKKKWVRARVREFRTHGKFCEVFYTSAKNGIGLQPIVNFLKRAARPGPWIYSKEMITTQSRVQLLQQLVRGHIFCWFNKDVPYRVGQKVVGWTYSETGALTIEHELLVKSDKVAKMVCGVGGRIVKQMQRNVSNRLTRMWNEPVLLYIHVKCGSG